MTYCWPRCVHCHIWPQFTTNIGLGGRTSELPLTPHTFLSSHYVSPVRSRSPSWSEYMSWPHLRGHILSCWWHRKLVPQNGLATPWHRKSMPARSHSVCESNIYSHCSCSTNLGKFTKSIADHSTKSLFCWSALFFDFHASHHLYPRQAKHLQCLDSRKAIRSITNLSVVCFAFRSPPI